MITLVLGGTRSGKSAIAEALAAGSGLPVTYGATARVDPADADHQARVAAHQARRPAEWATIECAEPHDLIDVLRDTPGTVLVDSLGTWVTAHPELTVDADELLAALVARKDPTIVVSEEVGLAVHPVSEFGRRYVDVVGSLNQKVAEVASRVLLVVAGRAVELPVFPEGQPPC